MNPFDPSRLARLTRLGALAFIAGACGRDVDCVTPPCLPPIAVTVSVTSGASAGPAPGAFVQLAGGTAPISCELSFSGMCTVTGNAGTYELDIGAPGFQTVHRSVVVREASSSCGCVELDTQHLTIALVPVA